MGPTVRSGKIGGTQRTVFRIGPKCAWRRLGQAIGGPQPNRPFGGMYRTRFARNSNKNNQSQQRFSSAATDQSSLRRAQAGQIKREFLILIALLPFGFSWPHRRACCGKCPQSVGSVSIEEREDAREAVATDPPPARGAGGMDRTRFPEVSRH